MEIVSKTVEIIQSTRYTWLILLYLGFLASVAVVNIVAAVITARLRFLNRK